MACRATTASPRKLGAAAAAQGKTLADNPFIREAVHELGYELNAEAAYRQWTMLEATLDKLAISGDLPEKYPAVYEWRLGYHQGRDALQKTVRTLHSVDTVRVGGMDLAKHNDDRGPPELRQHAEITTSETREAGESKKPSRTIDLALKMRKAGTITFQAEMAWRQFNRDFYIGNLDAMHAPDVGRTPTSGGRGGVAEHVEDAKRRVAGAMGRLGGHGSPAGNAIWYVCGLEWTINDFAKNQVYAHGASVRPEVARGVLIGAISSLEAYYAETGGDDDQRRHTQGAL